MFAVVRTGGKQYRVAPGDKIVVEKLDGNAGDRITLNEVLLAGDGGDLKSTSGLTVAAEIVAQAKGDKVTVFKKRRRHNYRRKRGHRQLHTILKIVAIGDHKEPKKAEAASKEAPKAETKPAARAKETAKAETAQHKASEVAGTPTESPAPAAEAKANPPRKGDVEDASSGKKSAASGKSAKAASTKNAAPAKAPAKKSPKKK
ncbi:MAG TPA: 50S ribosomal protein L21 [Sphingomicrobium sp.]|nr:50S ribosomal protein L21 [Sphingomicrobium sp.]